MTPLKEAKIIGTKTIIPITHLSNLHSKFFISVIKKLIEDS